MHWILVLIPAPVHRCRDYRRCGCCSVWAESINANFDYQMHNPPSQFSSLTLLFALAASAGKCPSCWDTKGRTQGSFACCLAAVTEKDLRHVLQMYLCLPYSSSQAFSNWPCQTGGVFSFPNITAVASKRCTASNTLRRLLRARKSDEEALRHQVLAKLNPHVSTP
jgi:hypothetical protein